MIRVTLVCHSCKTIIDATVQARKVQALVTAMNEAHPDGLGCFVEEESSDGQGQGPTDREEGGPDQPGSASPGGGVEGGAAPGAGRERGRRSEGTA